MSNRTRVPIKTRNRGRFDFRVFDKLPREVRDAINYAAFNVATTNLPGIVVSNGAKTTAAAITAWDSQRVVEAYEQREAEAFLQELGL